MSVWHKPAPVDGNQVYKPNCPTEKQDRWRLSLKSNSQKEPFTMRDSYCSINKEKGQTSPTKNSWRFFFMIDIIGLQLIKIAVKVAERLVFFYYSKIKI